MGRIRISTGAELNLRSRLLIGRSSLSGLRLGANSVSAEHALIAWDGYAWTLRDLDSANGTFVNGRRVLQGEVIKLAIHDSLQFGSVSECLLSEQSSPQLFARRLSDGYEVAASSSLLALPSEETVATQVYSLPCTEWIRSCESGESRVVDGQTIQVDGEDWVVFLPESTERTRDTASEAVCLAQLELVFRVSRDEEHVAIHLRGAGRERHLKPRAPNYLLLHLARRRLLDIALPNEEQGWMTREELESALRLDSSHVNVQLFRLRKSFLKIGVCDAGRLIEARQRPSALRIGVQRLLVQSNLDA